MKFEGFSKSDFETFHVNGLEDRMNAIQTRIQPKFKAIGETLASDLSAMTGMEMFLHIAKHARRTVNPPNDTWLAIANNKRGYKKHPHFQVGLFDDHAFIWLAYIYELPNKAEYAQKFLDQMDFIIENVPGDFVVSMDHMKKDAEKISVINLKKTLERFRDVKKAEFLIGRQIPADDPIVQDGDGFISLAKGTFETLIPIYKLGFA
ncbi:YktB family protein [Siminovitchia sediminis]|uniref:UPF0637 protein ACFSCZ_02010 n=1 Tax=Siminovitchia sediminis TaxID=1274353 RepID=A0ABW4KDA4_9BACI